MNLLIIFTLILTTVFGLPSEGVLSRNLVEPAGNPEGRITRGHNASIGQFPYQVGISREHPNSVYKWCGGSLLNNEWVLTAAHCTQNIVAITVLLGTIDSYSAEIMVKVYNRNIINHKGYNSLTLENDIALIKIPFTEYSKLIQPVKLPEIARYYSSYDGYNVIASGWGIMHDYEKLNVRYLQWARLNIISNRKCSNNFYLPPSNICTATNGGVNTCSGDSGGPLVLNAGQIQIGITSYGDEICEIDEPAVFTRVTSYLDWIKQNTGIFY